MDVLVRLLRLEEEELGTDQVGHRVVDRRAEEDDPLPQQAGEQVVVPLTPAGGLDHPRHAVGLCIHRPDSLRADSLRSPPRPRPDSPSGRPVTRASRPRRPTRRCRPANAWPSPCVGPSVPPEPSGPFELLPHLVDVHLQALAMAASSSSSSSSVTSMSSASTSARRARSAFTLRRAPARSSSRNSCSSRPVALRNWPMPCPGAPGGGSRSWIRSRSSSATSCVGDVLGDQLDQGVDRPSAAGPSAPATIRIWREPLGDVGPQLVGGLELGGLGGPFVGHVGQLPAPSRPSPAPGRRPSGRAPRAVRSKVKMSPTLAPRSWSSSSGTTPPLPTS